MNQSLEGTRILIVTSENKERGGREQLSWMLLRTIQQGTCASAEVLTLSLDASSPGLLEKLKGRIDGVSKSSEDEFLSKIKQENYDLVLLNGSNLGRLAKVTKANMNTLPVVIFYHNVETSFFFDALRSKISVRGAGVLIANFIAERWAAHYSNRRIMLNKRDSRLHYRIFKRAATDILPMAVKDEFDPTIQTCAQQSVGDKYALFVGGDFYANVEGFAWYAENVASKAPMETVVIGRGMIAHKERLEQWGGVRVVGEVENLAGWYANASLVVAPILSGSGMKTKTAEAMMHGKSIAGSPEAFVGYDPDQHPDLIRCNTPGEFLEALKRAQQEENNFSAELREAFLENYSERAFENELSSILNRVVLEIR